MNILKSFLLEYLAPIHHHVLKDASNNKKCIATIKKGKSIDDFIKKSKEFKLKQGKGEDLVESEDYRVIRSSNSIELSKKLFNIVNNLNK